MKTLIKDQDLLATFLRANLESAEVMSVLARLAGSPNTPNALRAIEGAERILATVLRLVPAIKNADSRAPLEVKIRELEAALKTLQAAKSEP